MEKWDGRWNMDEHFKEHLDEPIGVMEMGRYGICFAVQ